MTQAERLHELRELFLAAPESDAARVMAVLFSVALVGVVLWMVRRGSLREEYTPIWMAVAFSLLVVSLRLELLHGLTRAIGAWTTSSTLFFMGLFFLVLICLNYSVRFSRTSVQLKNLAQEVALLRAELERRNEQPGA